ncbi:phage terminase large subunit [Pantoea sp. BAV 3049]|uniref:phage terminase large subunit n=1 Tax=Pantoea sp. BAV 3049 TaxID=2654188 RepID=UPI00131E984E|nr:phage terminase large subunit [Pantoea sp. BAV 3049]
MSKSSLKSFRERIEQIQLDLRTRIENESAGLDVSPEAIRERRERVSDPVNGFRYFVNTYFPHHVRHPETSLLHEYLFERLPQVVTSNEDENEVIAAPRGEAKTTLSQQLFDLWCVVRELKKYIIIVFETGEQAAGSLEAIKAELMYNRALAMDYPEACGQGRVWRIGCILTASGIKIESAGQGQALRGRKHGAYRPDLVHLDDLENNENVVTPKQRDKLERWLNSTIIPLGGAGIKLDIIYVGSILHYDSVLARTLKNPSWNAKRFQAILAWPENLKLWDDWEAVLREKGKAAAKAFYKRHQKAMLKGSRVSWTARPLLDLMLIRVRVGKRAFDAEYQNDPVSGENAIFHGCIHEWRELEPDLIYFGACDPSLGKNNSRGNDPSALLVGGWHRIKKVLKVVRADIRVRRPKKIITDVIRLQKEFGCVAWAFESVQFQDFLRETLIEESLKQGVPVPARSVIPTTDKHGRIESLQPFMENERILIYHLLTTLIEQLKHFPMAEHDDGPDALHMLWAIASTSVGNFEFIPISAVSDDRLPDDDDEYGESTSGGFGSGGW